MQTLKLYPAAALSAAMLLFVALMAPAPALSEHEAFVAQTAREIRESGHWVVPQFAGAPRVRKTPLPYWTVAGLSLLTGRIDEFTARLPSALAGIGTVLCIGSMAGRSLGRRTGRVAIWLAACCVGVQFFGRQAVAEMQLTFWCTACYQIFFIWMSRRDAPASRWWAYLLHVVFGIAMMVKAPMAGMIVGAPLAVFAAWCLITRRWNRRDIWRLRPIAGLIILAAIIAPWHVLVWQRVESFATIYKLETLNRFSGELRSDDTQWLSRPWFYLPHLALFCMPWALSLPAALALPFRRPDLSLGPPDDLDAAGLGESRWPRREMIVCAWLWVVVSTLLLTIAGIKRAHYLMPAIPGALLLLSVVVEDFFFASRRPERRFSGPITLSLVAIAVAIGGALVTHHEAPDLYGSVVRAGMVVAAGAMLACMLFARQRRSASLFVVGAGAAGVVAMIWPALAPRADVRTAAVRIRALIDAPLQAGQTVRWVGRQRAPLVFYGPLSLPRIDDPLAFFTDPTQKDDPSEMMLWAGTRIEAALHAREPAWFVIQQDFADSFRLFFGDIFRVAGRVESPPETTLKPMLVITNVGLEGRLFSAADSARPRGEIAE